MPKLSYSATQQVEQIQEHFDLKPEHAGMTSETAAIPEWPQSGKLPREVVRAQMVTRVRIVLTDVPGMPLTAPHAQMPRKKQTGHPMPVMIPAVSTLPTSEQFLRPVRSESYPPMACPPFMAPGWMPALVVAVPASPNGHAMHMAAIAHPPGMMPGAPPCFFRAAMPAEFTSGFPMYHSTPAWQPASAIAPAAAATGARLVNSKLQERQGPPPQRGNRTG